MLQSMQCVKAMFVYSAKMAASLKRRDGYFNLAKG